MNPTAAELRKHKDAPSRTAVSPPGSDPFSQCRYHQGTASKGLPLPDKSCDFVTGAYVRHGVSSSLRHQMLAEAASLARPRVIFFDDSSGRW